MRTRYLVAFVVCCDLVMLFAGVPLERATWLALAHQAHDRRLLLTMLAANLVLFGVCICGFVAMAVAATRGLRFALGRLPELTRDHGKRGERDRRDQQKQDRLKKNDTGELTTAAHSCSGGDERELQTAPHA